MKIIMVSVAILLCSLIFAQNIWIETTQEGMARNRRTEFRIID
jgi:hypothetical protein